jgi:Tfp pilus assembly protein PilN
MEGVEDVESQSEKLGRLIPPLMEIADETQRIEAAKKILQDVQLPTTEWDNWLDALKV